MKRTPIKRKTSLARGGSIRRRKRGSRGADRTFVRDVIRRSEGRCERCGRTPAGTQFDHLQAHHLVPRSRAVGQPWMHDAKRNGAALCTRCHDEVHHHSPKDRDQWILREPRT